MLTAFVAVVGTVGPQIKKLFVTEEAKISASILKEGEDGALTLMAKNQGTRIGLATRVSITAPWKRLSPDKTWDRITFTMNFVPKDNQQYILRPDIYDQLTEWQLSEPRNVTDLLQYSRNSFRSAVKENNALFDETFPELSSGSPPELNCTMSVFSMTGAPTEFVSETKFDCRRLRQTFLAYVRLRHDPLPGGTPMPPMN